MVKPPFRTKSVGTKVSDAEYAVLEECARARGLKLSEWVRDVLLATGRGDSSHGSEELRADEGVLLGEVLALRAIVINLLFSVSQGERLTAEQMQALIERADGGKAAKAAKLLSSAQRVMTPVTE